MSTLSLTNHPSVSPLQKLWNREYAAQRLVAELEHAAKESHYEFSILLVEIEGLSQSVGNRLGYATRDDIWPQVLTFLTHDLRPEEVCCRLGGDEFMLILPATGASRAAAVAESLRRDWATEIRDAESALEMNVAVASSFGRAATIQTVFAVADEALDAERSRQRSRVNLALPPRAISPLFGRPQSSLAGNS